MTAAVRRISAYPFLLAVGLAGSLAMQSESTATASHGVDLAGMDRSVRPGDDFFSYANGTWFQSTAIPADKSTYGIGAIVRDLTRERTAALVQDAAGPEAQAGSEARKIGDFYASYMDEAGIEARGLKPLKPAFDRIAAISDRLELSRFLGGTLRADLDLFNNTNVYTDNLLGLWVAQDLNDPSRYVPFLAQGGLDMPDRDYYLDAAPRMADIRDKYRTHISAVLKLAQISDAEGRATRIFELERRIAAAHWNRTDTGDVRKGNNHWSRPDFDLGAPGIDWGAFLAAAGLERQGDFIVWQPSALSGISTLVASEPLETWKDYLTFHAIEHVSEVLPKAFVDERFAFHEGILTGALEPRERWKRAADATSEALGEAVGKLYVERFFPPQDKARIESMVSQIMAAFSRRLDKLDWMTAETRAKAKAKLAALEVGVGYPDKWTDYSTLEVVRGDACGNAERAELFRLQTSLRKLGRAVDRSEWVMTPQTVNAVNLPAMNALNFPAGMLQPPYFDPRRPVVMDYGAIGAIIGHEISHSFDDQGALFDANGKLANWWTADDFAHFEAAAAQLVKQYDDYRPFPDASINGKQTLGENIADVAGLAAAYDAYRASLGGQEAPVVDALSGDQQFFLAYAQSWRQKSREPALRSRLLTDGHSPAEYRVATVRNLDAWYDAFGVTPGQKRYLAPAERVRIW